MSDSPLESTEFESSTNTPTMESTQNPDVVFITADNEEVDAAATTSVEHVNNEEPTPFTRRKRKKTSGVWEHFRMVKLHDGTDLCECSHYGEKFKKMKYGTTTPLHRHIGDCPKLKVVNRGQLSLKVQPGKSDSSSMVRNWKFNNAKMREVISHMIMIHELPFNFMEYGLFNVVMKEANPGFNKISRASVKQDCISSYEIGKKRVQKLLDSIKRVSITTDMWTSNQNIHYMVVTCHFVDSDFKLHKRMLSFVDVPPSYSGVCIYDSLFMCLMEWNIETKVVTLTVDNAKTNDVVARKLIENLNLQKQLDVGGKLFHVRCCAHILNLLVQDGLGEIKDIIHNVRESVKHVNASPGRLHIFSELAKQLSMTKKNLLLDVSTRWNATYAMLSTALEFKEVFVNYADRESTYTTLLSEEDWKKFEEVCSFLALFNEATKIISGFEYPTSNLFLSELFGIKEALDAVVLGGSDYMELWYKMKLLEFSFQTIYSHDEASREMQIVRCILYELYQEYVEAHKAANVVSSTNGSQSVSIGGTSKSSVSSLFSQFGKGIKTGTAKYDQHIRSVDTFTFFNSELDTYLEEGVLIGEPGVYFDALGWWKENNLKFNILSKMAADILAIPVTNVASESAFSAGGRVIDPHRSSLGTKMVDMLVCGADWYRQYYGLEKNKNKQNEDIIHVELP
ncbi:zinc finger BED domain-containing protein RICESLEEPER 2-like [Hibiscus syriacus]|uniref:zinc finger BED domain-containing protein RICESLEEPER 2-like n=1 Tax=Hibiscus syriacus TaxID=106335 RepID=UPI0019205470|nr:zinc finger BED domain-containing protein RICESLEEPER 2-like [Hibiscus syriacus]